MESASPSLSPSIIARMMAVLVSPVISLMTTSSLRFIILIAFWILLTILVDSSIRLDRWLCKVLSLADSLSGRNQPRKSPKLWSFCIQIQSLPSVLPRTFLVWCPDSNNTSKPAFFLRKKGITNNFQYSTWPPWWFHDASNSRSSVHDPENTRQIPWHLLWDLAPSQGNCF